MCVPQHIWLVGTGTYLYGEDQYNTFSVCFGFKIHPKKRKSIRKWKEESFKMNRKVTNIHLLTQSKKKQTIAFLNNNYSIPFLVWGVWWTSYKAVLQKGGR